MPTLDATAASLPGIADVQALAADEMSQVNELIRHRLGSDVVQINQI
jgi:octaprenyl-diphosphate synthase